MTRTNLILGTLLFLISGATFGQVRAKAISYTLDVYLEVYDPGYYAYTESADPVCRYEVDAYFNAGSLKTIVREVSVPTDYDYNAFPLMYNPRDSGQFEIDHQNKIIWLKNLQATNPQTTGKDINILGFKCRQFFFSTNEGVDISVWVTDKPGNNINPFGNFSMKGTVMELLTSNGIHFRATDIKDGAVAADFFTLPPSYRQKVFVHSAAEPPSK